MHKLVNNNTDLVVVMMAASSIGLTFMKIMDVKDFGALALLILGYKFAKNQALTSNDTPKLA